MIQGMAAPSSADVEARGSKPDRPEEHDKPSSASIKDGFCDDSPRVLDPAAERRLCWKFDVRLLPVLAVMCTSRIGVLRGGNASDHCFSLSLSLFFFSLSFFLSHVFSNSFSSLHLFA